MTTDNTGRDHEADADSLYLHADDVDPPLGDCACVVCEYTRWWESLTPKQQDDELHKLTREDA